MFHIYATNLIVKAEVYQRVINHIRTAPKYTEGRVTIFCATIPEITYMSTDAEVSKPLAFFGTLVAAEAEGRTKGGEMGELSSSPPKPPTISHSVVRYLIIYSNYRSLLPRFCIIGIYSNGLEILKLIIFTYYTFVLLFIIFIYFLAAVLYLQSHNHHTYGTNKELSSPQVSFGRSGILLLILSWSESRVLHNTIIALMQRLNPQTHSLLLLDVILPLLFAHTYCQVYILAIVSFSKQMGGALISDVSVYDSDKSCVSRRQ